MTTENIPRRLKTLRRQRNLSQKHLAALLGFNDRQTISAIETGVRRVSASELVEVANKLEISLDYFTDPFRLDGQEKFTWRQFEVGPAELAEFERTASGWLGAYRALAAQVGRPMALIRPTLRMSKQSTIEEAMEAGERIAEEFNLGPIPSERLQEVMQDRFGILVLMVDAIRGISSGACRLPEFDAVLVARGEAPGRRNFDLAREFFHILTWNELPPKHLEQAGDFGGNRVENLANNFASALLMPRAALEARVDWAQLEMEDLVAQLNSAAEELGVTASDLRWRLVALKKLKQGVARSIPDAALESNGGRSYLAQPPLFSRAFVEVLAEGIDRGYVSVRRAARVVGVVVEDLQGVFSGYGVECGVGV